LLYFGERILIYQTRFPFFDESGLLRSCYLVSDNLNALLIVEKCDLGLCLLEDTRNFKVGIVIFWIELKDALKKLEGFLLVA
jgi:hypothetical protein